VARKVQQATSTTTTTTTTMNINRRSEPHDSNHIFCARELKDAPPRFVKRNLPFHQSRNCLNIRLKGLAKYAGKILLQEDWYHVLLRWDTLNSSILMLTTWTIAIMIFAGLDMLVDYLYFGIDCGLVNPADPRRTLHFGAYFAFSLQTATTVGYTLPNGTNGFFESCPGLQAVIYFQMVWSMMYNAFLFAFFYARLAKVEARAAQVIFSKTAIISRRKTTMEDDEDNSDVNPWTFSLRVADVDAAFPIVEAHIRLYAKVGPQLIEMRILSPNDMLGACLFLGWPTTIRHAIDCHSPLHPMSTSWSEYLLEKPYQLPDAGLNLRHAEASAGECNRYSCPVCGEAYGSLKRLRNHVAFYQKNEENDALPLEGSHRELNVEEIRAPPVPTLKELKEWYPDEIIALVEGVDPLTSGTFQAMQSYTFEDLSFGGEFATCCSTPDAMSENGEGTHDCMKAPVPVIMNLKKFHCVVNDMEEEEQDSDDDNDHNNSHSNNGKATTNKH
jgi:hypothetical protein